MTTLSDDRCSLGLPLRDHDDDDGGPCGTGCDFHQAVFDQALRDILGGVDPAERIAFERRRQKPKP